MADPKKQHRPPPPFWLACLMMAPLAIALVAVREWDKVQRVFADLF